MLLPNCPLSQVKKHPDAWWNTDRGGAAYEGLRPVLNSPHLLSEFDIIKKDESPLFTRELEKLPHF